MANIVHTNGDVQLNTPYTSESDNKVITDDGCVLTGWRIATDDEVTAWKIETNYIAEQKKLLIQTAKLIRDTVINEITNAKLLDDLQLDAGMITETIHSARKTARLAQLAEVQTTFYTTTGLTAPITITA